MKLLRNSWVVGGCWKRGQNQMWLPHPYILAGPQVGGIAAQPVSSRGSPNKGTKSQVATSPLPSPGPTSGRNCYKSPAFSGVQDRAALPRNP